MDDRGSDHGDARRALNPTDVTAERARPRERGAVSLTANQDSPVLQRFFTEKKTTASFNVLTPPGHQAISPETCDAFWSQANCGATARKQKYEVLM